MLTPFSKLLANRLARTKQTIDAHPDADALNALAENRLQESERQTVLAHLAACADCREVLSRIAPETPLKLPTKATWQNLRWPAAAAATILLTFTVLHHKPAPPARMISTPMPSSSPKPAQVQPAPPAPVSIVAPKKVAPKKRLPSPTPAASLAEETSPEKFAYARARDAAASSFHDESFALSKPRIASARIATTKPVFVTGANIWLAGEPGTLFHSIDRGAHWDQITVSDGATELKDPIIAIQVLPKKHTVRLKTPSGFWITTDEGQTWRKEKSSQ